MEPLGHFRRWTGLNGPKNKPMQTEIHIPTMAEIAAQQGQIDVLFWVGCAGSFDQRAMRITQAFASLMQKAGVKFAILGTEESCTGDPAKRAGNEFLFQMQASTNIQTLDGYGVKKIVTTCPHCFNTLKNEYPGLGGNYEVVHHTQMLQSLLDEGKLSVSGGSFKGKKITYHDACYLGRANGVYEAPRALISHLEASFVEMKRCKSKGLCCGAGGAQMFKESEAGSAEINHIRAAEAIDTQVTIIAAACPFCNTMMTDGVKKENKDTEVSVLDLAEIIHQAQS